MRKSKIFRPTLNDRLEDRTVPSHMLVGLAQVPVYLGGGGGGGRSVTGIGSGGSLAGLGGGCGGGGSSSSSTLNQDARLVNQAFLTFDSSYLSAAAALRLTATSAAGPSAAGLAAFDTAIATAITTLDASISTDLGNLTNT